jgi:hypothetical protein
LDPDLELWWLAAVISESVDDKEQSPQPHPEAGLLIDN